MIGGFSSGALGAPRLEIQTSIKRIDKEQICFRYWAQNGKSSPPGVPATPRFEIYIYRERERERERETHMCIYRA